MNVAIRAEPGFFMVIMRLVYDEDWAGKNEAPG